MMTKEANPVHNEKLMVAVRIRPMENISESNKAVTSLSPNTLVFMDGPGDKSDHEHSYPKTGVNLYSAQPSQNNSRTSRSQQPSNNLINGFSNSQYSLQSSVQQSNTKMQTSEGKVYEFDYVFDMHASQEDVYRNTTAPLVKSVFEGFCATVFAYGATSSGKTYSMIGTQNDPGIMKRSIDDIFLLSSDPERDCKTEVYLSYLEIYNEKIRDLLRPVPGVHLELREDTEQVHVSGLSEVRATSTNEVLNLLQKGNRARTMEPTAANVTSSRSHAVLLVTVRQFAQDDSEVTDGKLYLIDLAGSERASHTKNSGLRLREGGHINRSLLALGNCITALAAGDDKYINYRDSKLTRLLKAALGGPSKTVMIAHVSPAVKQREETRNTLLYGQRARAISNRVRKFIYPGQGSETTYIIEELRNEVKRLQTKLDNREPSPPAYGRNNRNVYPSNAVPSLPVSINATNGPLYHEGFIDKHERHELTAIKQQISTLFDEEFRLRNDLLKLDGAMLQSALDCEILRLMVLDWENFKSAKDSEKEGESPDELDPERSEINSVMVELKQVRLEQDKLLRMRTEVEQELHRVRAKISLFEEEAAQYLPEIQREILSLLCKLQQDQLNKMSVEIEAELKRRGSLLLRCLRQKALGEAIIHRQRHFISAISGRTTDTPNSPFLPLLTASSSKPNSGDKVFTVSNNNSLTRNHLPPLGSAIPTTTKYSDFRKQRMAQRHIQSSTSEEDFDEKYKRQKNRGGSPRKQKANSPNNVYTSTH